VSSGRVVVVGLGPAGPDLVTAAARDAISHASVRFVRTERHPSSALVADAIAFDGVYESADTIDDVYVEIARRLTEAAHEHGEVLYAVPGSPAVGERTVELLREAAASGDIELTIVPALSFVDLAWARLGIDPVARSVRIVDAHQFAVDAAGERGPLLVGQCDSRAALSDVKLCLDLDGPPIVVLQQLGTPDERIFEVARADLDRAVEPDHLTSLFIDSAAAPVASEVARFDELVHVLRERCPWDREQTHQSLTRHLLEETYEVLEALERLDPETGEGYHDLEEELGDLLFQICFHATLAGENGAFTLADVARTVHDKLVVRHPHVFGDASADTADAVMSTWEQRKKDEKGRESVFEGIPSSLPSLLYAHKVVRKAESVGAPVPNPAEVEDADAIGDALLAVVIAARALDVDPEAALRAAAVELRDRARAHETDLR
jgi:tetrapyrrole methylase family protein/MazG family protein